MNNNLFYSNTKHLYLITPPQLLSKKLPLKKFTKILTKTLKTKKIKFLQLRIKNKKKIHILNALIKIKKICKKYKTLCFVNDYTDNKILDVCDGVHLGQKDLTINKAKKIIFKKKYLGITCHNSKKLVKKALLYNPTYISFGSFFPSKTKKIKYYAEIKNINWFKKKFNIPCVAIGGINLKNCNKLLKTNCDWYALCSGVWNFKKGPDTAVKEFYKKINTNENISK